MHESARVPATSPAARDLSGLAAGAGVDSPEMTLRLSEDHDRIAEGLNDLVVRRLFAAGLALEAALALIGEHRAAGKIEHAISELDQAIADLRGTVFDVARTSAPGPARSG
jgi:signal transduction histidine kinase